MNWWNKDAQSWTPEECKEAQRAYWHTFLGADEGRKVLAHLRLIADLPDADEGHATAREQAIATLTRLDLVEWIRCQCGPQDELVRIRAEARTAAQGMFESEKGRPEEFEGFKSGDKPDAV